jgi:hypothetical protein
MAHRGRDTGESGGDQLGVVDNGGSAEIILEATGPPNYHEALLLVEATVAVAHGYASLFADGFFARNAGTVDDIAARATEAASTLITPPPRGSRTTD